MKNLKKALALVVALSVMTISGSAFAATCNLTGGSASISTNFESNTLTATVNSGATIGTQMTFVIFDQGKGSGTIVADDILYIDQKELKTDDKAFTGVINLDRVSGKPASLPEGSYPVKLGYYDVDGEFAIAQGNLVITPAAGVTNITTTDAETATIGTGIDLTATVTGVAPFNDAYTWAIDQTTNQIGATITNGNHLDATSAGTVTVIATATGDSTKTASKVVTFVAPAPKLTSVTISGDSAANTGDAVTLTASYVDPSTAGVTIAWSTSGGTLSASTGSTVTLTGTADGTVTVTATATSAAGDVETATHTIVFSTPAPPQNTVTIIWGDITLDNNVNLSDALAALYYSSGTPKSYPATATEDLEAGQFTVGDIVGDITWGDITMDGNINLSDALAALYYSSGTPKTYGDYTVGDDVEITLAE